MAVDLSWYWWYRRRYPEAVGWQERLLDSAPDDTRLRARALAHIALLARGYGDLERAAVAVSEAKARFDALGDRRGQAHVLWTLTLLLLGQERLAEARSAAREYLRLNHELGDLARQAFAFTQLGLVATFDEDLVAARSWHEQSLRLARTVGDRFHTVRVCYMLGAVRRRLGDYAGAAELFAEAAQLVDTKDTLACSWEWIFSGDLAVDQGQYERAAEMYRTALRHFQRVGVAPWVHLVTQRIAILAIRRGDDRRGVRILSVRHETDMMALASMFPELASERRRALESARLVLARNRSRSNPQLARHSHRKTRCSKP
jgi:tetratricopeptide (TPR) repeat protein